MAAFVQNGEVVLEVHENYQKGTFRNKCRIGTAQGELILSIPLKRGKHQAQGIKNVLISNSQNWQLQHWRSIQTAYSNAPFFEHYAHYFQHVYTEQKELLWDLNISVFETIQRCIGSSIVVLESEQYLRDYGNEVVDFRNLKRPSQPVPYYPQVHEESIAFQADLSILDLIFHLGPESLGYLKKCPVQ